MKVKKSFDINIKNSESVSRIAKAAKNGGVAAGVMIPQQKPIYDKLHLAYNLKRANEENFRLLVAIEGIANSKLSEISILKDKGASAVFINSDEDMNLIKRVFEYAEFLKIPLFINCNNRALSYGVMNDSQTAYSMGVSGIPNFAESIEVAKIYELSKHFEAKVVFLNITTKESLQILKNRPSNIYVDTSIDNLYFCDEDLSGFNTLLKTFPPLRSQEDKEALLNAAKNEEIDFISSNHTAATLKDVAFEDAEFGISKLDIFSQLAYSLDIDPKTVEKLISTNPAKLFGIEIDEEMEIIFEENDVNEENFASKAKKTPYKKLKVRLNML
ncbi:MAG: dihydroorotase [Epsilonproteobacteria bacterium]|nr:dihydroorotase [Campylobacterota bacterium]